MVLMCWMASSFRVLRAKASSLQSPRDGHLARHRPVAGVLLDAVLSGHELFPKTFGVHALCEPMARTRYTHGLGRKTGTPAFSETTRKKNARDMRA
jgi:hypothetical protein